MCVCEYMDKHEDIKSEIHVTKIIKEKEDLNVSGKYGRRGL